MTKLHTFKRGTKIVATDEPYWLKPGQVAYDLLKSDGSVMVSEMVCESWADFDRRLEATIHSEATIYGEGVAL